MSPPLSAADFLDILSIGLVAVGCLLGLFRGLSGEIARILALVGAFAAGSLAGPFWRTACASWFPAPFLRALVSVIGLLAIATLAGWLVRKFIDQCLKLLVPQPANAILGGVLGAFAAFCLASLLCLLLNLIPLDFIHDALLAPSRFWGFARPLATAAQSWF